MSLTYVRFVIIVSTAWCLYGGAGHQALLIDQKISLKGGINMGHRLHAIIPNIEAL